MGLKASPEHVKKKDLPLIAAGLHHAICYGVFHIGTQPPQNKGDNPKDKVILVFELPKERLEYEIDGVRKNLPRAQSITFTRSMHVKANLRKTLESWRGRSFTEEEAENFELTSLLGVHCMVNITHRRGQGKYINTTFTDISNILPAGKETTKSPTENPHVFFSFEEIKEGNDIIFPKGMPDWVRKRAMQSEEYDHLYRAHGEAKPKSGPSMEPQTQSPAGQSPAAVSTGPGDPF